tara:strand:- start:908 stop:1183 length:276 start_codon:yes stop_codon:yes gene_type:complete
MINYYSSYNNGLKVGDLINYKVKNNLYLIYQVNKNKVSSEFGVVLDREFLYENNTQWGNRKFFLYRIMNFNGKIFKIETKYIKILKRTGAL